MTILLTGADGFVGRAVLDTLTAQTSENVICVDRDFAVQRTHPMVEYLSVDLTEPDAISAIFKRKVDSIIHLAALPGGRSEERPDLSTQVNLQLPLALIKAASLQSSKPRFIFSSSIAVFGEPLPPAGLTDQEPTSPQMIYGMHKAMIETAIGTASRRGEIDGVSLRLPGIVARPPGPSGLKSAFMSEIFYALLEGRDYEMPVSANATSWLLSTEQCARNICHALQIDMSHLPSNRVVNIPALRIAMVDLVKAISDEASASADLISYAPDLALERAFGAYPPIFTQLADRLGFATDGTLHKLVRTVLDRIEAKIG